MVYSLSPDLCRPKGLEWFHSASDTGSCLRHIHSINLSITRLTALLAHTHTHNLVCLSDEILLTKILKDQCHNVTVWVRSPYILYVRRGCRGFVVNSTKRFLKEVGIRGQAQRKTIKELATAAERSSHWLWLRRKETWGIK